MDMELVLTRQEKETNYTIGRLSVKLEQPEMKCIDGELTTVTEHHICDTLEPKRRNLKKERLVPYHTAIPEGRYRVLITKSWQFGCWLPLVLDVPGFNGVRIYTGNYPADTVLKPGIVVGWNRKHGMVVNSRSALQHLMLAMTTALDRDEEIWLTVA